MATDSFMETVAIFLFLKNQRRLTFISNQVKQEQKEEKTMKELGRYLYLPPVDGDTPARPTPKVLGPVEFETWVRGFNHSIEDYHPQINRPVKTGQAQP